jgi:hypothetical protein
MENAALRTVARLDGTPFPTTAKLASRWLRGRIPTIKSHARDVELETAFCAEVVAVTYKDMGLLDDKHRPNWYDPGRFWSGDQLKLVEGATLGEEIAVTIPPGTKVTPRPPTRNA